MKTIESTSVNKKGKGRKRKKAVESAEKPEYTSVDSKNESVNTPVNSDELPQAEQSSETVEYTSVDNDQEVVNNPVNTTKNLQRDNSPEHSGLQGVDKTEEPVNTPISSLIEFLSEETQQREERQEKEKQESDKSTEGEEEVSKNQAKTQAEFTVAFLDNAQRFVLPLIARKKILGSLPPEVIENIKRRVENLGDIEGLTRDERKLWEKIMLYEAYVETLPFTKEEKKMLVEPLTEIYLKYGIKMAAEIRLLIALGTVMGARVLPLFVKM